MTEVEAASAPALDLSALVERLRLSGFRIDTRQYLTAHELLLALAATGVQLDDDPERLVSHLGPIFCTSVHEQDLFADEVRRWFGREPIPESPVTDPHARTVVEGPASRMRRRWYVGVTALAAISALFFGWRWYQRDVATITVQGNVVLELPDGRFEPRQIAMQWNGDPVSVDEGGRFVISATRSQLRTRLDRLSVDLATFPSAHVETELNAQTLRVVIRTPFQSPSDPVKPPSQTVAVDLPARRIETRATPWTVVVLGALALAALVWGLSWLIDWARRTLAIRRLPLHGDPELVTLRVPDSPVLPVSEAHLRRAAIALRRRRDEAMVDIDVPRTIDATVRAAGFFVPRFSSRRATPEYLALVSRRGDNDHQARTFDAILDHLADLGVVLDRYSFHDDPRFVYSETSARGHRLAEVVSRHHRATLLVCAESATGFNAIARQVASWVDTTRPLERRIYLTPEAPYRWTRLEFELIAAGFIVLPATDSGLKALADLILGGQVESYRTAPYARAFPSVLGTNEVRWLDRNAPPPEIVEKLVRQLKGFLGPAGFAWLCACAVYPEVTWPLTIRVAHEPPDYSVLPSLARLPWFRHGFMPDWLRRTLVGLLPLEDEGRLRAKLERLLEELSHDAADGVLPYRSKLRIARWVGPRHLLAAAAVGSPLRDQVFVGFMCGARVDPLWLRAPRSLTRVFRRDVGRFATPSGEGEPPVRSFRDRVMARVRWWLVFRPASTRTALSLVLGIVAFAVLQPVLTQARVSTARESISFAEVPGGEFIMGSDRTVDADAQSNEQPQHRLDVPTFWIATTEVTVAQYGVCVNEGACSPADRRALAGPADWPVRYVSWSEALEYCRWLENGLQTWGGTPAPIAGLLRPPAVVSVARLSGQTTSRPWHVTLPSEPEWEKAARGFDARIYPWGDQIEPIRATPQQAPTPFPVGTEQSDASQYGLRDMGGNVAEWTRSRLQPYPYSSVDGREKPDTVSDQQGARVIRGGSGSSLNGARVAQRRSSAVTQRDAMVGFRVAISSLDPVNPPKRETVLAEGGTTAPTEPKPDVAGGRKPVTTPRANPSKNPAPKAPATQERPDYASVLAVLQKLEEAYARLDVDEVARIWPSRAGQFRTQRSALNGMSLDVVQSRIDIAGDTATVQCELRWNYDWKRANPAGRSSTANVELTLRRTPAGSWVIVRP